MLAKLVQKAKRKNQNQGKLRQSVKSTFLSVYPICTLEMSTMGVYDLSKMLKADEVFFFHAEPDDIFIFSPDVLGEYCHKANWFPVPEEIWETETERFNSMDAEEQRDAYDSLKEETWVKLQMDSYDDGIARNLLLKVCVLHKILNPESKTGLACEERCGKNILHRYVRENYSN